MSGRFNGDLPRWAVGALIWMLAGALSFFVFLVRELPALPARVVVVEEEYKGLREEVRVGFRDLTQRMDRLLERDQDRRRGGR